MSASRLLRGALLACVLVLATACSANGNAAAEAPAATPAASADAAQAATPSSAGTPHFTAGDQFVVLKQPAGQPAPTGPVVLVEVFSYACPHCAEFAPYMDKLRAALPKGVEVRYMPAVFYPAWRPFAQAFYAARQLGVLHATQDAFFKARLANYPLNSLQDMAAFYARHGVDPKKFLVAATSARTAREMAADQKTELGWGIDATPTLVVGRRASDAKGAPFVALLRNNNVKTYAQMQQVGLWMVRRIRHQRH